ncbi:hypothetical protein [Planctomicrobium sp. SH527]|uniref:hypothetical protein n=1 Tax=Planctomicrobium sp. SH527 TaxID=3448123 RepID=UPI003F5BDF22
MVRYIGGADRAGMVTEELARLQAESKLMHELRTGVKIANRMIREAKRAIEPVLKESGFVFHGLAVRKPRVRHP